MPTVSTIEVKINVDAASADRKLDAIEQKVTGMPGRIGQVLGTAGGFLLARGLEAVVGRVGGMVDAALDFESQMANVNSILQLGSNELQAFSDQVLGLTSNPGITDGPAMLAAGLYDIASAGFSGQDGLAILEAAALGAAAGVTETAVATDALTGVLLAYGISADQAMSVTDQMFQVVNDGKITFEELASNLGRTLAPAAQLGIGFDELGAAYALMSQTVGASETETQIAALMRTAFAPTDALTAAITDQGYASAAAAIQAEGLTGYLEIITGAAGGSEEALFAMLGSTEALNAALLLGGENLEEYTTQVLAMNTATDGAGATQRALEKQMESANFAIGKAKQQAQVAATVFLGIFAPGIRAGAEAVTSFLSGGVIPFTNVISDAIRGGFTFRDSVDALPQPLRRSAGALGSIVEAAGDVVRSFGERGLAGAFRTLTEGGEGRQILTALGAIGDELLGLAGTVIDFTIDLLPEVGDWLWDKGTDAASWLYEEAKALGGWVIRKLPVAIDFLAEWGGVAWGRLPNFEAWFREAAGKLRAKIDVTIGANADEASKQSAYEEGVAIGEWINQGIGDAFRGIGGQSGGASGGGGFWRWVGNALTADGEEYFSGSEFGQKVNGIVDTITFNLEDRLQRGFEEWRGDRSNSQVIEDGILGYLNSLTEDDAFSAKLNQWGDSTWDVIKGALVNARTSAGEDGFDTKLIEWLNETGESVSEDIIAFGVGIRDDIYDAISGAWEDATNPFESLSDSITGWISTEFDEVVSWLGDQTPEALQLLARGDIVGAVRAVIGGGDDDTGSGFQPAYVDGDYQGSPIDYVAESAGVWGSGDMYTGGTIDRQWGPRAGGGGTPAKLRYEVDVNTTDAETKINNLKGLWGGGSGDEGSTFTGILDLDNGPAALKFTDAFLWGDTWASQIFESEFSIDNGPAALKYTDAFMWGETWADTTFTATFSVDISPLERAAQRVIELAGTIDDYLPHSPARKGPLARPISFGYIADDLERNLDRMAMAASYGMNRVSGAFDRPLSGPSIAGSGSGDTYNITFITPESEEYARYAREALRGGDFARELPELLRQS